MATQNCAFIPALCSSDEREVSCGSFWKPSSKSWAHTISPPSPATCSVWVVTVLKPPLAPGRPWPNPGDGRVERWKELEYLKAKWGGARLPGQDCPSWEFYAREKTSILLEPLLLKVPITDKPNSGFYK